MLNRFIPHMDVLPAAQKRLWPLLSGLDRLGFVLYGETAAALRLGHRRSVDFDFFSDRPLEKERLVATCPVLQGLSVVQEEPNTLSVVWSSAEKAEGLVKLSFFGGIGFGRIGSPDQTSDGTMQVASAQDLLALKLGVIINRVEAKDYKDIAALLRSGLPLLDALAGTAALYPAGFNPFITLNTLSWFEGGDLKTLPEADKRTILDAMEGISYEAIESLQPAPIRSRTLCGA